MTTIDWALESFSLKLAITLLHFLWQGGAIALLALGADRLFRRADAQWRYTGHVIALLLMATCVPVTFCLVDVSWASRVIWAQAGLSRDGYGGLGENGEFEYSDRDRFPREDGTSGASGFGRDVTSPGGEWNLLLWNDERPADIDSDSAGGSIESPLKSWSLQDWSAAPFRWSSEFRDLRWRVYVQLTLIAPYLALAYFVGSLLMMGRLAAGLRGGDQLRKRSSMLGNESWLASLHVQAKRIGVKAIPAIAACEAISVPVVVGVFRPMILLPAALISGLSPDQLQALILHELAHIRRHDTLVNLLQRLVESLLFFHPAVWIVSHRISRERELVADDIVLNAGWDRTDYAHVLVCMAELSSSLRKRTTDGAVVVAASGTGGSEFRQRVLRLIEPGDDTHLRLTRRGIASLMLLIAFFLAAPALIAWGPPTEFSETEPRGEVAQAAQETAEPASRATTQDVIVQNDRVDRYGDPLPDGAIARFGTQRSRSAYDHSTGVSVAFVPGKPLLVGPGPGRDRGLGIWDPETGELRHELTIAGFSIHDFDISPDGSQIAILARSFPDEVSGKLIRLQIRDIDEGTVTFDRDLAEPQLINSLRIAFTADGKGLAIPSAFGQLSILDVASGEEVRSLPLADGGVVSMEFSADGKWLAAASNRRVTIWDLFDDVEPFQLITEENEDRGSHLVTFSPDGKWLATVNAERTGIQVWDLITRRIEKQFEIVSDSRFFPQRIEFSSDSRVLAVPVVNEHRIELRDVASGERIRSYDANGIEVWAAAVSSDGKWVAGIGNNMLHVWSFQEGEPQHQNFVGHREEVHHIKFTPDGKSLVTAPFRAEIGLWDVATSQRTRLIQRDGAYLTHLSVSPDGKYAVGMPLDNTIRLWDLESGRELHKLEGHGTAGAFNSHSVAFTVAFNGDSQRMFSFGGDMQLRHWDVGTGKAIAEYDLRPPGTTFEDLSNSFSSSAQRGRPRLTVSAFSPGGSHLHFCYGSEQVIVDTSSGEEIRRDNRSSFDIQYALDGSRYALAERHKLPENDRGYQSVIRVYHATTHDVITTIEFPVGLIGVSNLQISEQGDRIAVGVVRQAGEGNWEMFLRIHDARSGELQASVQMPNLFRTISLSPDGRRLAIGYTDTTVVSWDVDELIGQFE